MYSNAGPVMVVPLLVATGRLIIELKFAVLVPAAKSQPLHTMV